MVSVLYPGQRAVFRPALLAIVWSLTLLASALPAILWRELAGSVPGWLFWSRIGLLAAMLIAGSLWSAVRPLRPYIAALLVLSLAEPLFARAAQTGLWQRWFMGPDVPFITAMLGTQLVRLGGAICMLATLFVLHRRRASFFLVAGRLDAPAQRVAWLGIDQGVSWTRLGSILVLCISSGTLAFLLLAGRPSRVGLIQVIPLLPMIAVLAAMNAFSEELNYRAALLASLHQVVGTRHALAMTAAYFGLAHYYGVPYGIIGVAMAGFLGWLLGKSMLETGGFFWAWFIHFWQDVLIFAFMTIGAIVAGGQ